jgi:hypothetical protein
MPRLSRSVVVWRWQAHTTEKRGRTERTGGERGESDKESDEARTHCTSKNSVALLSTNSPLMNSCVE